MVKLKQCTDLFILSKDKRPVNASGQYSTIDGAADFPVPWGSRSEKIEGAD